MKSKTIELLFLLTFIAGIELKAQSFKYGIQVGLDVANSYLTNKPDIEGFYISYYPMLSFNVNAYLGYKKNGHWGFSIEPGFIQKGAINEFGSYDNEPYNKRINYNYLNMPILVDIYLSDRMFISGGAEFAYFIREKTVFEKFELSGLVGVNYCLTDNIDIGVRYNHGITDIQEIKWLSEMAESLGLSKEYNQYFQMFIRFKI